METKKRRYVRRTPESYRKEVEEITNGEYVVVGDFKKVEEGVLTRHTICGYSWSPRPNNVIGIGISCPKCSNYKRSRITRMSHEEFCLRLFKVHGENVSAVSKYNGYKNKIYFRCNLCGDSYQMTPETALQGSLHKLCKFRFEKKVYDLVGSEYKVVGRYLGMDFKVDLIHKVCGKQWSPFASSFIYNECRCPNCVYSRGEKAVADVLDSLSIEYIREHSFEYLGRNRYDFYIPSLNIAIEYDGEQHYQAVELWGGEEALKRTQESDALKNDFCDYMGIDLLRIPYWEFDNIDEIVTNFIDTVKLMRSISANGSEMEKCR